MFTTRPDITLRKVDETAFVNAQTFWVLSIIDGLREYVNETYELRIKHQHPEDEFTLVSVNAAERDPIVLLSPTDFEDAADAVYQHEDGVASLDEARSDLVLRGYQVMTPRQAAIFSELARHWSAFLLLFNPTINL